MSGSNCCFLTCIQISQETGKVVWYSHLLKTFPVCCDPHKGFGAVNKAHDFLEFSCFFNDPADVGSLISGSSAFSKSSLNILKFSVHILLKPSMENFEHYFTCVWDEYNCTVVWIFFGIGMETDLFQSCDHCWIFQICWHTECSTFTASSFRVNFKVLLLSSTYSISFLVCYLTVYSPKPSVKCQVPNEFSFSYT